MKFLIEVSLDNKAVRYIMKTSISKFNFHEIKLIGSLLLRISFL